MHFMKILWEGDYGPKGFLCMINVPLLLQVRFSELVFVHEVHIYETYNGGALVKIEAMVPSGRFIELWSVEHPQHITQARVFKPDLQVSNQVDKNNNKCTHSSSVPRLDSIIVFSQREQHLGHGTGNGTYRTSLVCMNEVFLML